MIPLFATTIVLASGLTAIAFAYYYLSFDDRVRNNSENNSRLSVFHLFLVLQKFLCFFS